VDVLEATASYERWLRGHTRVIDRDLQRKHVAMAENPFRFLRATFYRFVQLWEELAPELRSAPAVLAVGDLHVENFGTWRDAEGRLVWGINDFDEAHPLPFTIDLLRLATSAHFAVASGHLSVGHRDACAAILDGYVEGLETGGRPFVLGEHNTWLWRLAVSDLRDAKRFWQEQAAKCAKPRHKPPADLVRRVRKALPADVTDFEILHRTAGTGSLGRQRFLFRADWLGCVTSREAKALLPSAAVWATGSGEPRIHAESIVQRAVRAADPSIEFHGSWLIRRLAADCSKIDLAHLPTVRDETKLLWAMGFETANVHLGSAGARSRIRAFLRTRRGHWLHRASKALGEATRRDFESWKARGPRAAR